MEGFRPLYWKVHCASLSLTYQWNLKLLICRDKGQGLTCVDLDFSFSFDSPWPPAGTAADMCSISLKWSTDSTSSAEFEKVKYFPVSNASLLQPNDWRQCRLHTTGRRCVRENEIHCAVIRSLSLFSTIMFQVRGGWTKHTAGERETW